MKVRSAVEGDVAIVSIANLQQAMFRAYPQGQVFDVITNGKNTMLGYGDKLTPEERWAVVAYLRALQLSQSCPPNLVPASVKATVK
jgi:mono/diheme cytochrome c family protein